MTDHPDTWTLQDAKARLSECYGARDPRGHST